MNTGIEFVMRNKKHPTNPNPKVYIIITFCIPPFLNLVFQFHDWCCNYLSIAIQLCSAALLCCCMSELSALLKRPAQKFHLCVVFNSFLQKKNCSAAASESQLLFNKKVSQTSTLNEWWWQTINIQQIQIHNLMIIKFWIPPFLNLVFQFHDWCFRIIFITRLGQ